MSHSKYQSARILPAARLSLASLACALIVGCVGLEQPPYVQEDAKSKALATCQAKAQTEQQKADCAKPSATKP